MQVYRSIDALPAQARGGVFAIGKFDGEHRGHRIVIEAAQIQARAEGALAGVICFEPHPREIFEPDHEPFRLTPEAERIIVLRELGLDVHVVLAFDDGLRRMSAERFIDEVLVAGLGVRHVVVGYNFRFGHKRLGDVALLRARGQGAGFGVTEVAAAADLDGAPLSSTRARALLARGQPRAAARILGRPFEIVGTVERGDQRGRDLGFPTANLALGRYLRPAYGIYAVKAAIDRGEAGPPQWIDGVANLGIRPMWRTEQPVLETHLIDFSGDLYGKSLRVRLMAFLRGEARFDGVDALIAQMTRDTQNAKRLLHDPGEADKAEHAQAQGQEEVSEP